MAALASITLVAALAAQTYCNPLPLPDYPVGIVCRGLTNGTPAASIWAKATWNTPGSRSLQFRELADPSMLYEDGVWYIFPSVDLCWKSVDGGATWKHVPLKLSGAENAGADDRIGYAPTVVRHRNRILLVGSNGILFAAESPEGPYVEKGKFVLPSGEIGGETIPKFWDPMLFSDDGRLYLYWGSGATEGIWGCELDADDPLKIIDGTITKLIAFEPETQPWEIWPRGLPEKKGYLEGAWMFRSGKRYYLTYAAAGTDNPAYAMGQAIGSSPLGKFVKSGSNPFLCTTKGPVIGTSHGSVIEGPSGSAWVAYTIYVGGYHWFERMIGIDRVRIGLDGSLAKMSATSTPQYLSGKGDTGWSPLAEKVTPGAEAAIDLNFATYYSVTEVPSSIEVGFAGPRTVKAYRLIWRDIGLDERRGICRGPYRYRIDYRATDGAWRALVDASQNTQDLFVDYRETESVVTDSLRLTVLGRPNGITPGIAEFTPFGVR